MNDSLMSQSSLVIHSQEVEERLYVTEVQGVEALSTLYDFDLTVQCASAAGLHPDVIDSILDATVTLRFGPGASRSISGVISHVELLQWGQGDPEEEEGHGAAGATYHFELVPRFWRFQMTHRSRCFVNRSIPDIFEVILKEYGFEADKDYSLRLIEKYPDNADRHVVQFEESDFSFMCRWMERLGMYFFFEQSALDDTEDRRDLLVITDSKSKLVEAEPHENRYTHEGALDVPGRISGMSVRTDARPRRVHVRDFNWGNDRAATSLVKGDASVHPDDEDDEKGHGLQFHYGDHFLTNDEGDRLAEIRAQAWMARKRVYRGSSGNYEWAPGHHFKLSGTPNMPEIDGDYLITAVSHQARAGAGGGGYSNVFEATELAREYRSRPSTPWPRIEGVINARIDAGEISSAAPIDDRGFYRVVLPYDAYGKVGERPTAWIRKAEAYAGIDHGSHYTLHSGAEVLLAHINGDPDRPVIVGAMPNTSRPSPISDSESTRHVIRTRSGILMTFEDDGT